jgi:SHS2 domain-containing protein
MEIEYTQDMETTVAGSREVEHTADWQLHVWAPNLLSLLEQSARGMYQLSHTHLCDDARLRREFELRVSDREILIVDFLSELLYYAEDENIAFDEFQLDIKADILRAYAQGALISSQAKEIKAVTYHGLEVQETENGLEVQIVFDV